MSHACPAAPAAPPPNPAATTKRRGNPNLALAPRCGARTRAGCACRSPAIRGKLRCRMHGGRSTGPRTAEGMERLRAARTVHGGFSAATRARLRYSITALRRGLVGSAALVYVERLPAGLAGRLMQIPPELMPPAPPSRGLTPAEDRAVLRAETEALAPWRAAIAQARSAGRACGAAAIACAGGSFGGQAGAHAPVARHRDPTGPQDTADRALVDGVAKAHAPERAIAAGGGATASLSALVPDARVRDVAGLDAGGPKAGMPAMPVPAAPTPSAPVPGVAITAYARAHAPERQGAATAPPAAHGGAISPQAEATAPVHAGAHAPEGGPEAGSAVPAAPANRAERRRLKSEQRHWHKAVAARRRP